MFSMKKSIITSVLLLVFGGAQAADIAFAPPADGGFSINSHNGDSIFRVDSSEKSVIIKNLPETFGDTPLCWNSSTGALSPCAAATGGRDTTPPSITTNAPAIATASNMTIQVTCTDDTELLACGRDFGKFIAPGVKDVNLPVENTTWNIGQEYSLVYAAMDMSGNATKKSINIQTPVAKIPFKAFNSLSPAVYPAGFSCGPDNQYLNNKAINGINVYSTGSGSSSVPNWSLDGGYYFAVSFGDFQLAISASGSNPNSPVPFDATEVSFPFKMNGYSSGSSGNHSTAYTADLSYDSSKNELSIEVVMNCGTAVQLSNDPANWNWTKGTPLIIVAKP